MILRLMTSPRLSAGAGDLILKGLAFSYIVFMVEVILSKTAYTEYVPPRIVSPAF